ncbi:alpha/beta hydrolase [Aspergillus fijiensis CBS 313.89]|uniref:Alpha/beta-hydrolase n=1 Tax=Aspergillus fijiensis CBS 313.89 TaxID=1448319 RepID=A0A8G1RZA1_9EURO|nr:alpha/beta-hydrolase [Aspergillus fijiensis CBS 313.89]RAK81924.1 alpha/beta-hydrolase [Aspergillus fijiensis CBS 313.89]
MTVDSTTTPSSSEVYPPIPPYKGRWHPPAALLDAYNHMWIDTDVWALPSEVQYALYPQPTRGPGAQGSYLVVLPPGYSDTDLEGPRYPVLYWLHGGFSCSRHAEWSLRFYYRKMELGKMPACILIAAQALPKGRWINSYDGTRPLGDIMRRDLVAAVDERYRTIRHPSARWLEGHSAGGYGAWNLGLKYPEVFGGALSSLAGSFRTKLADEGREVTYDTYNGSQAFFTANHALTLLERQLEHVKREKTKLRLLIGDEDVRLREAHEHMWETLTAWGVEFGKAIVPGAPHTAEDVLGGLNDEGLQFWWDARAKVVEEKEKWI